MDPIGRIRSILSNYVSPITGEAIIAGALRRLRPGAHELGAANLERVVRALDRGIDLFVVEGRRAALRAELAELVPAVPAALALEIKDESDIDRARELTSSLCERMGARPSSTWKVVSGVVALASQLASRPSLGLIEVIPMPDPPRGVRVRAVGRQAPLLEARTPAATPRLPAATSRTPLATPRPPPPGSRPPPPGARPSPLPPSAGARPSPLPPPAGARPSPLPPPASPSSPAAAPGALDGALPTIRRVADRFDVRGVGNRTHVEFDVWFSSIQRSR